LEKCLDFLTVEPMKTNRFTRREFVKTGLLGCTTLAGMGLPTGLLAAADPYHGLKVGITTYTLRKFSLDQAIAMTREAGVKYISLKEVHLALKSTKEQRQEARKKVEAAGLVLMGGGVIYIKNNEEEIRNIFDYARDAGMPTIVCSPDLDALDSVEKMAKKYDLRIAIHNHGPGDKKYPSPHDVWRLVKDRDARMGLCMDVGHTVRIGEDPVAAIKECASRMYEFHMKDVNSATASGKPVEVGKGVIDIPGVLKALLAVKFGYHVALEYEAEADNPMPGVLGSYAYMRKVLAS
jgi:sugar phosphate isomerase/epimerase